MKGVFHKETKQCLGIISYCTDGQEGGLVGFPQEKIIVKELDQTILDTIDSAGNSYSYKQLKLNEDENVVFGEPEEQHVLKTPSEIDLAITTALDDTLPLEERFNATLKLILKNYVKRK